MQTGRGQLTVQNCGYGASASCSVAVLRTHSAYLWRDV